MSKRDDAQITPDDWQRVEAAAAGDAPARAWFCGEYRDAVRAWLWLRWRHTPFRGQVQDGVQEVFLECLRPGGALEGVDPALAPHGLEPFLRGVVHNVACRIERSEARDFGHRRTLASAAPPVGPGCTERLDRSWLRRKMVAVLEQIDGEGAAGEHSLREFLLRHFEDGMAVRAIAALWGVEVQHVHELRRRACRRFRIGLLRLLQSDHDGADPASDGDAGREALAILERAAAPGSRCLSQRV